MIGSSCLKPFHAAVMCALVASTQPLNFPIMSWKNWKVGTALSVPSPTCAWVEFKVSVGVLSRLYFLYLNMLSFFSVLLTLENHLWIQMLQVWQSIEFIPTPLKHTTGSFNITCWLLSLTLWTKYLSLAHIYCWNVLQASNWMFKSSKLSLTMARSTAYRSFQGQPTQHSWESFHHNNKK